MALGCVATASKYLDDAFVSNKRYAEIGGVSTRAYNDIEIEILKQLNFGLSCPASLFRQASFDLLEGRIRAPVTVVEANTTRCTFEKPASASPKPAAPPASSNRYQPNKYQSTDYASMVERAAKAERAWGYTSGTKAQGASAAIAIRQAEEAPYRDTDTRGRSNSYGHTPPTGSTYVAC